MNLNNLEDLNLQLAQLREFLDMHSDDEIRNAVVRDDFESLVHLPPRARQMLADCPDLADDVFWYMEIRSNCKLEDFPCVHIAYAMSSKLNRVMESSHGAFLIRISDAESVGIAHCPWCGKRLNICATRD